MARPRRQRPARSHLDGPYDWVDINGARWAGVAMVSVLLIVGVLALVEVFIRRRDRDTTPS